MSIKRAIVRAIVRPTVNLLVVSALVLVSIVGSSALSLGPKSAAAQEVTVVVEGPLQSINNNVWVVNGMTVEITTTTSVTGAPVIGSTVKIVAIQRADGKLTAHSVTITVTTSPAATPAATLAVTPVSTAPATPAATFSATGIPFASFTYVKVIIEGPVEAVDLSVNVIIVYKQRIRLRANDPIRAKVKKGDWVRVDGNMERERDNQIIIVVINIIIINPPPVIIIVQPGNNNPGPGGGGGGGRKGDGDDDDD